MSEQKWEPVEGNREIHMPSVGHIELSAKWIHRKSGFRHYNEIPDGYAICRLVPADAPDALTVRMTKERIAAIKLYLSSLYDPDDKRFGEADKVLQATLGEPKGGANDRTG